jgi:hypothetical protein
MEGVVLVLQYKVEPIPCSLRRDSMLVLPSDTTDFNLGNFVCHHCLDGYPTAPRQPDPCRFKDTEIVSHSHNRFYLYEWTESYRSALSRQLSKHSAVRRWRPISVSPTPRTNSYMLRSTDCTSDSPGRRCTGLTLRQEHSM